MNKLMVKRVTDIPELRLFRPQLLYACSLEKVVQAISVSGSVEYFRCQSVLISHQLLTKINDRCTTVECRWAEPLVQAIVIVEVILVLVAWLR